MISYSASNVLLSKVSTAAPYWGAFGIDVLAIGVAGHSAARSFPKVDHRTTKSQTPRLPKKSQSTVSLESARITLNAFAR